MSAFTDDALVKKLRDLNTSSQSIQTLSLWLIHHRKHHEKIVKIWMRELSNGNEKLNIYRLNKKLIMINCSTGDSKTRVYVPR